MTHKNKIVLLVVFSSLVIVSFPATAYGLNQGSSSSVQPAILAERVTPQTTWSPSFNPQQQVYIDPKLAQHPTSPVSLEGLSTALNKAATQHDLDIYVVAAEKNHAATEDQETNWAVVGLDQLASNWQGDRNFPRSRYLIVYWLRRVNDPSKGWVAANAGSELRQQGLTADEFSSPFGPVIPALRQYMPQDPQGAVLAIVNNVNAELSGVVEAQALRQLRQQQQEQERRRRQAKRQQRMAQLRQVLRTDVPRGFLALGLISGCAWLTLRFRHRRAKALSVLDYWHSRLARANEKYLQLEAEHFDWLKLQSAGANKFQGETQKRYQSAVTEGAELIAGLEAANQRLAAAGLIASRYFFPLTTGFEQAFTLLTVEPIAVTGQKLPLEKATLFGALDTTKTYAPGELLGVLADLFGRANRDLAAISKAINNVAINQAKIADLILQLDNLKQDLIAQNLPFEPYAERWQRIRQEQQTCLGVAVVDPIASEAQYQSLENQITEFKSDLELAVTLRSDLHDNDDKIAQLRDRISGIRHQLIDYNYPLVSPAAQSTETLPTTFTLSEPGANPDLLIAAALEYQAAAVAKLVQGDLRAATTAQNSVAKAITQTEQLLSAVLSAKTAVESDVSAVQRSLVQLSEQLQVAESAMLTLTRDFLPHNYAAAPEILERVNQTAQVGDEGLAQIKAAYDRQHYLSAKQRLEVLAIRFNLSLDLLHEISSCLSQLRSDRARSRETVAQCQQLVVEVEQKIQVNTFTTARQTQAEFEAVQADLAQQIADVAAPVTDWVLALNNAVRTRQKLTEIEQAISSQAQAHQQATTRLDRLRGTIATIKPLIDHSNTLPSTKQLFRQVQSEQESLQRAITCPHSDWVTIAGQADKCVGMVEAAVSQARVERAAAQNARSAIEAARSAACTALSVSSRHSATAELGAVEKLLATADQLLTAQNYEAATEQAKQATAEAQVIQAQAEREQKRQFDSISSSSSWSSSSDWSSGGSSYDSGSGGSSYDGGSGGGSY